MYIVVEHEEWRMARVISQHKSITRANESMIMQLEKVLGVNDISLVNDCWGSNGCYVDEVNDVYITDRYCAYYDNDCGFNYWLFILEVKGD